MTGREVRNLTTETQIPTSKEILASRECFFAPVSLKTDPIFCGDERVPVNTLEPYIHWFGGALNPAYNLLILQESNQPGSVTTAFKDMVEEVTPVLIKKGYRAGVHSDTNSEKGKTIDVTQLSGDVGCGYALKRALISGHIFTRRGDIVSQARMLKPELFTNDKDLHFVNKVIDAHGALAERETFQNAGREVVLEAMRQGAESMLVDGNHISDTGIINDDPRTSMKSGEALLAGQSAYVQDTATLIEACASIQSEFPHNTRQLEIAELIDTIGTMWALGVKYIAVRRPQAQTV